MTSLDGHLAARGLALLGLAQVLVFSSAGCSLFVDLDHLSPQGRSDAGIDRSDAAQDPTAGDLDDRGDRWPGDGVIAEDAAAPDAEGSDSDATTSPTDADPGADGYGQPDVDVPDAAPEADTGSSPPTDAATERDLSPNVDAAPDVLPPLCPRFSPVSTTLNTVGAPPQVTGCGYVGADLPRFYAAVDPQTFAASAACGTCIQIETAAATVTALVVDQGPARTSANPTAIAVSQAAVALLLPDGSTFSSQGVQWRFTPCPLTSPGMTFTMQNGSNASYAAVLVQNYRYRLDKVEVKLIGVYQALTRSSYNYWVASQGMGSGPFTLRMTDQFGNTVEQAGIPLTPGKVFTGQSQFPSCRPN